MSDFSQWDEARRGERNILWSTTTSPLHHPPNSTRSQTGWGQATYKNCYSLAPKRAHCLVYMFLLDRCVLLLAPYFVMHGDELSLNRHIGSLRIACDSHRLHRDQNSPNWCRTSSWCWKQHKLGGRSKLALYINSNGKIWSQNQACSDVALTPILPHKAKTQ